MMRQVIFGASLGECIHVAGLLNFLQLAESVGFETAFLGPAVPVERLVEQIRERQPEIVALSYRLSSESCQMLLEDLERRTSSDALLRGRRCIFGGTVATAGVARQAKIIEKAFDGTERIEEIVSFLKAQSPGKAEEKYPETLLKRMTFKHPASLLWLSQ